MTRIIKHSLKNRATTYQVPLTYRAGALAGADGGLIGTSEHGVLGRRWIYDGVHDPVLLAQLVAIIQGEAAPQAQSVSNATDSTVTGEPVVEGSLTPVRSAVAANGPAGTELRVEIANADDAQTGELTLRINRILQPGDGIDSNRDAGRPCLSATCACLMADMSAVCSPRPGTHESERLLPTRHA